SDASRWAWRAGRKLRFGRGLHSGDRSHEFANSRSAGSLRKLPSILPHAAFTRFQPRHAQTEVYDGANGANGSLRMKTGLATRPASTGAPDAEPCHGRESTRGFALRSPSSKSLRRSAPPPSA